MTKLFSAILVLASLLITSISFAGEDPLAKLKSGQKKPVAALIDRIVYCNHWQGEEPYDADRAKEINNAILELRCGALDKDEASILKRYKSDSKIKDALRAAKDFSI